MNKLFYMCVLFFISLNVKSADQVTIEDMYASADIVARVKASSISYRIGSDRCIRHHWGAIKEIYKGKDINKEKKLDLGHSTYYDRPILDEYIVFIKSGLKPKNKLDFSSFEGKNLHDEVYSEACLKSISQSYMQIWNDSKGALRITDDFSRDNKVEYIIQLPDTVLLPNFIKRVRRENATKEGWYLVKENDLI